MIRTYTEMMSFDSFYDRFNYLNLSGQVGKDTFGYDRYLNQSFYKSAEWKRLRNEIILRDDGCDLAHPDYQIKMYWTDRIYYSILNIWCVFLMIHIRQYITAMKISCSQT